MNLNKKYILFDNDGVLVHTEALYFKANVKALKELGIDLSFEKYLEFMNYGGSGWEEAKKAGVPEDIIQKQIFKRNKYYQEFLKSNNIKINGVLETLELLSLEYKMAIVTTSKREDFELIHKNSGILDYMEFSLCYKEYEKVKPHGEPYLKAMEKLGAKKQECIIVEDSYKGLNSALNAKIDCITVFNEFTQKQDFSKSTYRINNFSQLLNLL